MALRFFENSLESGMLTDPNTFYHEQQQAFQTAQWDNTSARKTIFEQDDFGVDSYHEIECWTTEVIGTTSTFMKNGQDYMMVLFENIDKHCERGLMYKYDDNYWLADFTNPEEGLGSEITLRRCNNWLRMIDPDNGSIFSIPCVIDYDMTSPSAQVSRSIITPNNHASVFVQANKDTLRLFTYNTRFMLRGRPFKLLAFQDTLNRTLSEQDPPILYLDLYLDELHAKDDIQNQLADNGDFIYSIIASVDNLKVTQGAIGKLDASVLLNGNEVARKIIWTSNSKDLKIIDNSYEVSPIASGNIIITGTLEGNPQIKIEIPVVIVEQQENSIEIDFEPMFNKIRQHESIAIYPQFSMNGVSIKPDSYNIIAGTGISLSEDSGNWIVKGEKLNKSTYIEIEAEYKGVKTSKKFSVSVVSMFG